MATWIKQIAFTAALLSAVQPASSSDTGLITKQSNHTVADTIEKFEAAVNAKSANGWMVLPNWTTRLRRKRMD